MKLNKILTAAAFAVVASASFADTGGGALDVSTGSTSFSRTPAAGLFTDTWTFSLVSNSFLTSSTLSSSAVGAQDLMFTTAVITTAATPGTPLATFVGPTFAGANEFLTLSSFLLASGKYDLIVTGLNSAAPAAYSGTITVAAIPEPETYALMLAGLGVIGFMAKRRSS